MVAARFHSLRLSAVDRETADAVRLTFEVPEGLSQTFAFTPGQYLTLRAQNDGQDIRRSYSICSALGEPLAVGVKRIAGGTFSTHALDLMPGSTLDVMTPQGRFLAPVGGTHDYLLFAAGSGITPMMSIARSVLEGEAHSTVTLLYANRETASVMFRRELDDLKDRFLTRFRLTHVMDVEPQDIELFNGRLDAERIETLATRGLIDPVAASACYICGPQPMIETVSSTLAALGVPSDRIRYELFTPPGGLPIASESAVPVAGDAGARVSVLVDGATRNFPFLPGDTMVMAAAREGVDFPWSCNNGMCATCRCKLADGAGKMAQNFSLEPWEQDAGFVLACQFRPESRHVTLDFDAV